MQDLIHLIHVYLFVYINVVHPNGPFQKKGKPNLFGVPDPDHLKPPRGGPNDNDFGFGF